MKKVIALTPKANNEEYDYYLLDKKEVKSKDGDVAKFISEGGVIATDGFILKKVKKGTLSMVELINCESENDFEEAIISISESDLLKTLSSNPLQFINLLNELEDKVRNGKEIHFIEEIHSQNEENKVDFFTKKVIHNLTEFYSWTENME